MRHSRNLSNVLFTAGLLLAATEAASAQTLTVNGLGACFTRGRGVGVSRCGVGTARTQFSVNGDRATFARSAAIGAPGGESLVLEFGPDNLSNVFSLGAFSFVDRRDRQPRRRRATTSLDFSFFLGETPQGVDLRYRLGVTYTDRPRARTDFVTLAGGGWSEWFAFEGHQYRFQVVGLDLLREGSVCETFDPLPTAVRHNRRASVCGQFERQSVVAEDPSNDPIPVPEPSSMPLLVASWVGLAALARSRRALSRS